MERSSTRNAAQTRASLLQAAFGEIFENGFQAASLERILARTAVTKGALYHHFPTKHALGLAVIEEVVAQRFQEYVKAPLAATDDPLPVLRGMVRAKVESASRNELPLGCPLNNLIHEMAPLDAEFRARLERILRGWREAIADALARGQRAGRVRPDVDTLEAASFITAAVEGAQGLAKATHSVESLLGCMNQLDRYLDSLATRRASPSN